MAIAPKALIQGAARQPLQFGLFSTFAFRPNSDRWEAGAEFETLTCDPVDGIGELQCEPGAGESQAIGLPKNLSRNSGAVGEASAFTVYGHWQCSPVGYSPDDAQELATAHLQAREESRVEQAFWTGDLGNTPALATKATKVLTETSNPSVGLGELEQFIATIYGSVGTIHMTRKLAVILSTRGLLQVTGGRLTTLLGTPIAAGSGYPGTGPNGEAGDWAYATPALFGYRSDIMPSSNTSGDLLDRGQNDLYAIAERSYLLGFDPCGVGAVNIDTSK